MDLYDEIVARGIKHSNHYSDLYIPVTPETRLLVQGTQRSWSTFTNQVEGGLWYDVPFAYLPYWRAKQA